MSVNTFGRPSSIYCRDAEHYNRRLGKASALWGTSFVEAGFYDAEDGMMQSHNQSHGEVCAPMVMGDLPDHEGPSGKMITSRSHYREELKRTNTVPYDRGLRGDVRDYIDPRPAAVAARLGVGRKWTPETKEKMDHMKARAFEEAALNSDGSPKELVLVR